MLKIKREVKIGLLITISFFIFIWGINFLRGTDIFSKHLTFYAIYKNTEGLIKTSAVSISGVKIGHVENIFFHPDGSGNVIVKCIIERQIEIPDNSIARLRGSGLTGTREIDLVIGNSFTYLNNGDTIPSVSEPTIQEEISLQLGPVREKAETILSKADTLLTGLNYLFQEDSRDNILNSIENINKSLISIRNISYTTDTIFQNQSKKIAALINNAESISENLKNNNEVISHILKSMDSITDSIASANITKTINNANISLEIFNKIIEKIEKGESSAGMLVNDDSLYINLSRSSHELELLLEDVRNNPRKYINVTVFGRNR